MKLRSLAIGLSLVTAGTFIGVTTQQFASAEISSGDRPVLVPVEPCRLVDTRPGDATVGPRSSPLVAADTLTVDAQEAATACTGLIPNDALSLSLNVTAVGATEQTFLTIWAGGPRPDASSLNPAPGAPPTPNAVTVDLSAAQEFEIYNNLGTVNIIVDINGYYEHHNHDDLYYTKPQVEQSATPQFTEITYEGNGTLTVAALTPTPQKVRDLGDFESDGGTVKVSWTSFVGLSGGGVRICHFQIRVDGQTSRPTAADGLAGTEAKLGTADISVPASTVDVFQDLPAGPHTVELWIRSNRAGSCFDNPSGWPQSVLVEEFAA